MPQMPAIAVTASIRVEAPVATLPVAAQAQRLPAAEVDRLRGAPAVAWRELAIDELPIGNSSHEPMIWPGRDSLPVPLAVRHAPAARTLRG